jgi:acyl-CoA dehydrogenase
MDFAWSEKTRALIERVSAFMERHVYPNERAYHEEIAASGDPYHHTKIVDDLKARARAEGLWNLFLPDSAYGAGLTNLEYAPLAELMGRVGWASEVFNCAAPDTGNMEILAQFGTPEQRERWLRPLLDGEIRSGFAMTEPDVASSDATNIRLTMRREGDEYVLDGRKWWTTGAGRARCKLLIVMGKANWPSKARGSPRAICWAARATASPSRRRGWGRGASTTACAASAGRSGRWS